MLLLSLLTACTDPAEDSGSAVTCSDLPAAAYTGGTAFVETTDAWGLTDGLGSRLAAADLDADGYTDLIATDLFTNARDDLAAGVQYHRVYMNREVGGRRTFVDETEASGLLTNRDGGTGTSHNLYVFGDVDADGDLDAFAGRYVDAGSADATGDCSEVYLNDGAGRFTLTTASAICVPTGYPTTGASFTDYDADGVLDLWVVGFYEEYGYLASAQDQLYRGEGDGTFSEVTEDVGLKLSRGRATEDFLARDVRRPAYGATACDVDGNDLPDLIATNYGRSWNQLWRNDGGAFTEVGEDVGFDGDDNEDYRDSTRYACWYEAEGTASDPAPTVDCGGAWPPEYWTPGYDDQAARLNGNSFTTVCGDVDNDGDADLMTTEIAHKWAGDNSDATGLLFNEGGAFVRADNADIGMARRRPERSDWNEGDIWGAFFDFDNDGWKDVLVASSDYEDTRLWLWRQVAPGQFEEVGEAAGLDQPWPAGLAIADFDRDGDLDVVTGSSIARSGTPWTTRALHFHENQLGGNHLSVAGLPVGTRVEVEQGGLTQVVEVSGGYGHMGMQHGTDVHFGLGGSCAVDRVRAVLPGGAVFGEESGVAGNRVLRLEAR
jgi:hypothetical protein